MIYKRVLFPFGFPTKFVVIMVVLFAVAGALICPPIFNAGLIYFGQSPWMVWWQGALVGLIPWVFFFICLAYQVIQIRGEK